MTTNTQSNNKRIAKNTLLLYFRMIVTTLVSLYTARLTLQLLGVEDYGVYNVVGGIIGFMSIITGTMVSATQRFLAFDLGKNDIEQYQKTFSMLINIFVLFSIIAALFMEIIGPYVILHYLVIPPDRLFAAQWVFQFTVLSFVLGTILIPYTSSIVSYEKMGIYAYFTFIDVAFKLGAVYALYITPIDKLITYASITMLTNVVINIINWIYCSNKLQGCKYIKYWDSSLFNRMMGYAGWNLFGSTTSVMNSQGQAILLNIFFGPTVNAGKAIADKINQVVYSFCQNFFMAMNPQIIKTYAAGEIDYTKKLVINSSKFAFFLLAVIAIPLISNMEFVLNIWLGKEQVSLEMVRFSQLILCMAFTSALESPITQTVRATGEIKRYQIVIGCQTLMFIPLCLLCFYLGAPAYFSMILLLAIYVIALAFRIYMVRPILSLSFREYFSLVINPVIRPTIFIVVILSIIRLFDIHSILLIAIDIITTLLSICFIGLSRDDRRYFLNIIKSKIHNGKQ